MLNPFRTEERPTRRAPCSPSRPCDRQAPGRGSRPFRAADRRDWSEAITLDWLCPPSLVAALRIRCRSLPADDVALIVRARGVGRQNVAAHCVVTFGYECIPNRSGILTSNQDFHQKGTSESSSWNPLALARSCSVWAGNGL